MTTELKALYKNFDDTFLHLYPDFVTAFNNLLVEEERFELKPGGSIQNSGFLLY